MSDVSHFILIDDEPIINVVSERMIKSYIPDAVVTPFNAPEDALEAMRSADAATAVLLDINMPGMDGWGFLDEFENMPGSIRQLFRVYILSSSLDDRDRNRAGRYPSVSQMFSKPLSFKSISLILRDV